MKNDILFSLAVAALLLASLLGATQTVRAQTTVLSIQPAAKIVYAEIGGLFNLTIQVNEVTALWGWKAAISWNASILQLNRTREGSFLPAAGQTLFASAPADSGSLPEVMSALLDGANATGNGTLATLTFQVVARGTTNVTIDFSTLLDPANPHGAISHTTANAIVETRIPGDVDGNRIVNMLDLYNIALRFGSTPSMPNWNSIYDVDSNNIINMLDLYIAAVHFGQTA
jgi:hypothetical protein